MPYTIIESKSDLIIAYAAKHAHNPFLLLDVQPKIVEISSSLDLAQLFSEDLFGATGDTRLSVVAQGMVLTKSFAQAIIDYSEMLVGIYPKTITAVTSALLKPALYKTQLDKAKVNVFFDDYCMSKNIQLTKTQITNITENTSILEQKILIDTLSLLELSDFTSYLSNAIKVPPQLPFMKKLYSDNPLSNRKTWYESIKAGEEQLILSLLLTKAQKLPLEFQRQLIPKLINADLLSKSITGLSASNVVKSVFN